MRKEIELPTRKIMKKSERKPNVVGWSLTDITVKQIKKIAVHFRLKKVRAIHKVFDILFDTLADSEGFKKFSQAYDESQANELSIETSVYASFAINPEYMKKFKEVMYGFEFTDRSPFFRLLIDYIYNYYVMPVSDLLPQIKKDIESKGYKVDLITPVLDGQILVQLEKPNVKKGKNTK